MKKHPIPLKRLRRRALGALAAVVVLAAVAVVLGCGRLQPRTYEIVIPEEPGPVYELPVVTPPPEPAGTWTRYPVPLDDELQRYIAGVCGDYGVDPALALAVMSLETGGTFDCTATGDGGESHGLMQIWRSCHEDRIARLGVTDLTNPRQNILVGVDLLEELIGRGNGVEWALSYYSGNEGVLPCGYAREALALADKLTAGAVVVEKLED